MLTIEALRHYNVGFEIGDMFGKGRMKELIFNFKEQSDWARQWPARRASPAVSSP